MDEDTIELPFQGWDKPRPYYIRMGWADASYNVRVGARSGVVQIGYSQILTRKMDMIVCEEMTTEADSPDLGREVSRIHCVGVLSGAKGSL